MHPDILRLHQVIDRGTTGDMSVPPPLVNRPLTRLFAGESRRIVGSIDGAPGYERGVSLLAVYRRSSG